MTPPPPPAGGPDFGGLLDVLTKDRPAPTIARESGAWAFVPDEATQALEDRIVGVAGNGAPLGDLFDSFGADAASSAQAALMTAMSTGTNPLMVAQLLAGILGVPEARAETIARTELVGAYRDAQLANYRANDDVVRSWMWSAGPGCCVACMFMDGSVHPLYESMDSHANCRCSPIPVTYPWSDILAPLGIDASDIPETSIEASYVPMAARFLQMNPAEQLAILGPAKYGAWVQGDIHLDDLVGVRDAGKWGKQVYERSLKELGLNALDYLPVRGELPKPLRLPENVLVQRVGDVDGAVRALFGRTLTDEEHAQLVGALDNSFVQVKGHVSPFTGEGFLQYELVGPGYQLESDGSIILTKKANAQDAMYQASIQVRQEGDKVVIGNVTRSVRDDLQGQGIGLRLLKGEVEGAYRFGVDNIGLFAAGGGDGAAGFVTGNENGYYVWARLGFNGPLSPEVRAALPEELSGARTVRQLMDTPAGRAWWKANGEGMDMEFKLTPGGRSVRALDQYLQEKGLPPLDLVRDADVVAERPVAGPERFAELPTPEGPPRVVTRTGTYPDGRQWTVREYRGAKPPAEETSAYASLGRDDGAHWRENWMQRGAGSPVTGQEADWLDQNPRFNPVDGVANQQCQNCGRIFDGPLAGEHPDHLIGGPEGTSHGVCPECAAQIRHDNVFAAMSRRNPGATVDDLERMTREYMAHTDAADAARNAAIPRPPLAPSSERPSALRGDWQERVSAALDRDTASEWADALGEHGQLAGPIAEREEALAWEPKAHSADVSDALSEQLGVHVNLDELHPAAANQFAQALQVLQRDFPEVFEQEIEYIGQTGRDYSAHVPDSTLGRSRTRLAASTGDSIGFNRYFWSAAKTDLADLTALLQDQVETGWFFDGAGSPAATLAHEFGHSLQWWAENVTDNAEVRQLVGDFVAKWSARFNDLSAYAMTESHEAFAEAFAAHYFGSAEVLADPMVEDMSRLLGDIRDALDGAGTAAVERDAVEDVVKATQQEMETRLRELPEKDAATADVERFAQIQKTFTREELTDQSMAELRQTARELDVQPARTKAETVERILAKQGEAAARAPAAEATITAAKAEPAVEPAVALRTKLDESIAKRELLYSQQHDLQEEIANLENQQRFASSEGVELRAKHDLYRETLDKSDPEIKKFFKARDAYFKNQADMEAAKAARDRAERVMDRLSVAGKQHSAEYAQAKADYDAAVAADVKLRAASDRLYAKYWGAYPSVYVPDFDSIAGFESHFTTTTWGFDEHGTYRPITRTNYPWTPEQLAAKVAEMRAQYDAIPARIDEIKAEIKAMEQPIKDANKEVNKLLAQARELGTAVVPDALDATQPFGGAIDLPEGHQPPNALMNKIDYRMHEPRAVTKRRIIDDVATRLKDNPAWQAYVERAPRPNLGQLYHDYVPDYATAKDSKSAQLVADWIKKWGVGYRPGSPQWVAMQMAARDEFGLGAEIHAITPEKLKAGEAFYAENGDAIRALMRAMYENTQQWFADHGITEIEVYRGFAWSKGDAVPANINWGPIDQHNRGVTDIALNPFQSFSADINISQGTTQVGGFGGGFAQGKDYNLLIGAKVPVDRVLSTAQTGFGAKLESEIVVMGRATDTVAYRAGTRDVEALLKQAEEQIVGHGGVLYMLADGTKIQVLANADGTYTLTYLDGPQAKLGNSMKVGGSKTVKSLATINRNLKAMGLSNVYAAP